MPIRGAALPGRPDVYVQRGESLVTLDEAKAMKREEMRQPAPPDRCYLTDLRGCEFRMEEIKQWSAWNKENTPPEYLGRVAYIVDEPVATAYMMMLAADFGEERPAGVFSTRQGALSFLGIEDTAEALDAIGLK